MITTGVLGQRWRASVTPWGAVQPWSDTMPADAVSRLDWFVAADDRWHVPADDPSVRQERVDGTAVVETRIRVPRGDVVHTVASVADQGGLTVVEVANESPLPVAIAFSHRELLTERRIADVPIQGIDLPDGAFVLPLGHQAAVRVAIPHTSGATGALAGSLPSVRQVARGWLAVTERASRFVLPDGALGAALAERVVGERCELALGVVAGAGDDAAAFAVGLGELVRMGEAPDPWLPELADAVESLAPVTSWEADVGLDAAARVLAVAGERRAQHDLARIAGRRTSSPRPAAPPPGALAVPWLESLLADGPALLPAGIPAEWLGQPVEVYGVPTGSMSSVSFAIRWHGARPAVLWEQAGDPVELRAPIVAAAWRTTELSGEALWPEPPEQR